MSRRNSYFLEESTTKIEKEAKSESFGTRHTLAFMGFLGFTCVYAMRINLSVAIVAMVNDTESSSEWNETVGDGQCPYPDDYDPNDKAYPDGEFYWDTPTQGLVLGSFFYGYIFTALAGGVAAERWGGRLVMGLGIVITALLTMLSPLSARVSTGFFIAVRIMEGLAEGVTFPAMISMIAKWYPREERPKFTGMIFSGVQFGTVITMPITGWLCATDFLGGWPAAFYVFGFLGVVWGGFWFFLVRDDPREHPRISNQELNHIIKDGSIDLTERVPVPFGKILTSRSFWVIATAHFGNNWGFYTLLTELPTFLDRILHVNIKNSGMISCLPYLGAWIFCITFSLVADRMIASGRLSILSVRRLAMAFGGYGPMLGLIIMCFVNCNRVVAFVVLILSGSMNGSVNCGHMGSPPDISPRFAGTIMGLSNTFATIPGFVGPIVTGALTEGNNTLYAWRKVFLISAVVYLITMTIYIIFYRTEVQPWNEPKLRDIDIQHQNEKRNSTVSVVMVNYKS